MRASNAVFSIAYAQLSGQMFTGPQLGMFTKLVLTSVSLAYLKHQSGSVISTRGLSEDWIKFPR